MNLRNSRYDPEVEMFVEPPRDPDMARLLFLRWLGERRLLEHPPAGLPAGDLALRSAADYRNTDGRKAA